MTIGGIKSNNKAQGEEHRCVTGPFLFMCECMSRGGRGRDEWDWRDEFPLLTPSTFLENTIFRLLP